MKNKYLVSKIIKLGLLFPLILSACAPAISPTSEPEVISGSAMPEAISATPLPTRPVYQPGQLVEYIAKTGDNLPALASHFNTTVKEIRQANPIIPTDVTTLPPGLPMKIPIYYESLWGNSYQILPDSLFVNGPAQVGFDPDEFVKNQPGWFKNYSEYAGNEERTGGQLVKYVAENFSISPRLLLMLIEYQTKGLSQPNPPDSSELYPLGFHEVNHQGLYKQLLLAANTLNNGYYQWRDGSLKTFDHLDGRLEHPDPWQNAATVALDYYFSRILSKEEYEKATYNQGFAAVYQAYFGEFWKTDKPHIPGSLHQPEMHFPFLPGKDWAFTGGPHTGWGEGSPWAALDFAPPSVVTGCKPTEEWATAMADGFIVRAGQASAVLDLDGDHDERTGWVIFYLHLATDGLIKTGTTVKTGDPLGHPSCEGGTATGTHVHIARKYNGEWIAADGPLAFDLEGWEALAGKEPYQGKLVKFSKEITACVCSDSFSHIQSEAK
jgi:LasA protease